MEITIHEEKISHFTFHGKKKTADHESRKYPLPPSNSISRGTNSEVITVADFNIDLTTVNESRSLPTIFRDAGMKQIISASPDVTKARTGNRSLETLYFDFCIVYNFIELMYLVFANVKLMRSIRCFVVIVLRH